jgi:hypothetical protein
MEEKIEIKAVELVRSIRDRQAELLAGKSNEEIIEFFRQAGEAAIRNAKPPTDPEKPANMPLHQTP